MFAYPLRAAALAAAAITLSGCGYNGLYGGVGVGSGYYGSQYGYGYPGYGYSRLGYGYDPYWGWNDGFYYPGTGYYVYDRYRRPFRWTDAQRRYWEFRRQQALGRRTNVVITDNWGDFVGSSGRRDRTQRSVDRQVQVERSIERPVRVERRVERSEAQSERSTTRAERRSAREQRKAERAERRED